MKRSRVGELIKNIKRLDKSYWFYDSPMYIKVRMELKDVELKDVELKDVELKEGNLYD